MRYLKFLIYPALLLLTNISYLAMRWSDLPAKLPRQVNNEGVPTTFFTKPVAMIFSSGIIIILSAGIFLMFQYHYSRLNTNSTDRHKMCWFTIILYSIMGLLTSIIFTSISMALGTHDSSIGQLLFFVLGSAGIATLVTYTSNELKSQG